MVVKKCMYLLVIHEPRWKLVMRPLCDCCVLPYYPDMLFQSSPRREGVREAIKFVAIRLIEADKSLKIWTRHDHRSNHIHQILSFSRLKG